MKNKEKLLQALKERFPQHSADFERLFQNSLQFQEICTDYMDIANVLTRCLQSTQSPTSTIKEYQTLLSDLENEIISYINNRSDRT